MEGLVYLLGIFGVLWSGGTIVTIVEGDWDSIGLWIFVEICLIVLFVICLKKYRNPEYQAKLKEKKRAAQEKWSKQQANAAERKRLQTTIVSARLIGEGSAEYKKSVGSVLTRGAIGGLFAGAAGATLGIATAKNKNTNKNVRRFLVKYLDGHIEEKEATIGSSDYEIYMAHLEWED